MSRLIGVYKMKAIGGTGDEIWFGAEDSRAGIVLLFPKCGGLSPRARITIEIQAADTQDLNGGNEIERQD